MADYNLREIIMDGKPVTVLLVEDDDVDVMNVKRSFEKLRIANPIVVAGDGVEALELLRKENVISRPVVVLLDLNMPRMGGLEFLKQVRDDENLKSMIVFVLTTSKADEDKTSAYSRNVAGYILKSSDVGNGFLNVVSMLENYWKIVELPK